MRDRRRVDTRMGKAESSLERLRREAGRGQRSENCGLGGLKCRGLSIRDPTVGQSDNTHRGESSEELETAGGRSCGHWGVTTALGAGKGTLCADHQVLHG